MAAQRERVQPDYSRQRAAQEQFLILEYILIDNASARPHTLHVCTFDVGPTNKSLCNMGRHIRRVSQVQRHTEGKKMYVINIDGNKSAYRTRKQMRGTAFQMG